MQKRAINVAVPQNSWGGFHMKFGWVIFENDLKTLLWKFEQFFRAFYNVYKNYRVPLTVRTIANRLGSHIWQ